MEAGLLVYGENERIDALGAGGSAFSCRPVEVLKSGAPRSAAGCLPGDWGTALSCRPAEVLSWRLRGAIAGPDATALRTRLGDRARSLLVASGAPVLA